MMARAIDPDLHAAFVDPIAATLPASVFEPRVASAIDLDALRATLAATVAEVSVSEAPLERRRRRRHRLAGDQPLPEVGAVIDGKYLLDELVGAGGFGVVYRATHLLLHMPVAIKLLQPEMVKRHPTLPRMLCTEAQLAARVSHVNLVRVLDASHTPERTYLVMEYIDGSTLADAIESKGPLPVALVLRIGLDVATGLKASYAAGLIHRDIKPSNILLSHEGDAKIADLGLAQLCVELDPAHPTVVGTAGYMAPELGSPGLVADARSDMYSLGVTLYQAICGRLPLSRGDVQRSLERHRLQAITPPHELVPSVPLAVSRLLMWLLAKHPDQRPATYDVLIDHLRRALDVAM
jgi:serine/threonine-protein kinase